MHPAEPTPADKLVDQFATIACEPPTDNNDGLPYPIRKGVITLGSIRLKCYVLNTGQRIIDADDVARFMEGLR